MESRSKAEGKKGGLIHFDPLPSAKQTPQTKACPKNITSSTATENSKAGTGWNPQHGNLHKANFAKVVRLFEMSPFNKHFKHLFQNSWQITYLSLSGKSK